MIRKSENIYLLNDESKKIRKAIALISRTHGAVWLQVHPLNDKHYFAFKLDEKLVRRIKLSKLNNNIRSKKISSLHKLINNCKRFDIVEDFESYKKKNKKPYTYKTKNTNFDTMPKLSKKDNQRISYDKSKWGNMSKSELIKVANDIGGVKVRKPKKTANKRTWKNFLEIFGKHE